MKETRRAVALRTHVYELRVQTRLIMSIGRETADAYRDAYIAKFARCSLT